MIIFETTASKSGSIGHCSLQRHCRGRTHYPLGGAFLARANFKFEKRQKELAKQKKNEEKRLRKLEKRNDDGSEVAVDTEVTEVVVEKTEAEKLEEVLNR